MTVSGCATIKRRAPVSPTSRKGDPKEPVGCPKAASLRSVEDRQLLPQRKVFQDEFLVAAERQREGADDHDQQLHMRSIVAGVGAKINSAEFCRGSGALPAIARTAEVRRSGPREKAEHLETSHQQHLETLPGSTQEIAAGLIAGHEAKERRHQGCR
jgi:hypothetical protein